MSVSYASGNYVTQKKMSPQVFVTGMADGF